MLLYDFESLINGASKNHVELYMIYFEYLLFWNVMKYADTIWTITIER